MRLISKIKEACSRNGSVTVVLFCDEAQRDAENEYEWLRDVHDHLDRIQIGLYTFLFGQQELLSVKMAMQRARKTQIVAGLMVEELAFNGVRNAEEVATCLAGYDQTSFPRASDWSLSRFFVAAYRPAQELWHVAVRSCGYIQSRQAVGTELATTSA